ncbi:MAG: KAP family NTPase [Pseudomonadales bacterium]|jgi:hypothetical protein|nr:KAP family NTPase [Pseudomonadales bacterium]
MTPKKPVSNFLNNAPCGEDLFKGKSQTRIADCISSHIKKADAEWTEENHLGHIIGVEGGWGSGKTNVTQILKKTINRGGKKYIFFDYDLWAYQEDLKRRSILEALMHFLKDNYKCFREKEWIDREKELFAKTVESEKKTTPKFGFGLLLGISVIILIPITSMVAEIFIKDESGNNTCLAIFVTLIPALIVILFAVGAFVHFSTKWIFDKKIQTSDGWWPYVSDSMSRFFLNVYKTEAVDLKTKETISESEPSVKDFRDWMDAVSTDLEKKKVDKKLVIIFDNLDRIQDQSIQEIWSLINTFFAEKTYKNIWVIVPFDQERVRKSFKSRVNETGAAEDFCSDYVNKTFDVVYRVAPPIMTDWKNYFRQMWSKAFGKSEDEQLQAVIDVYESLRKKTTPRDINAFINSVVATRQIFPEIPLEYVAIFCGSKDAILSDPVTRILSSDYLGSIGSKYKDDKDLAKYTAALVYQVDPSQAIEVALWQELQIALEEGNSIKTKEIADSNVFFDLLSPHLNSIVGYNNAIVALSTVSASVFPDKQSERGVWNTLYTKTIKQKGYGQKINEADQILISKVTPEHLPSLLKRICSNLGDEAEQPFSVKEYIKSIDLLINETKKVNSDINIFDYLTDAKIPTEQLKELIELTQNDYEKYKLIFSVDELDQQLASTQVNDLNGNDYVRHLKDEVKQSLTNYKSKLEALIVENQSINNANLPIIYDAYKQLGKKPLNALAPQFIDLQLRTGNTQNQMESFITI